MNMATPTSPARPAGPHTENTPGSPRVWPALVLVAVYWSFRLISGSLLDLSIYAGFFSMVGAAGLLILLFFAWWLTNRRIKISERLGVVLAVVVGAFIAEALSDKTIGWFSVLIPTMLLSACTTASR